MRYSLARYLVENSREVDLDDQSFPVRRTPKRRLREVDFVFDGQEFRGLEQNPETGWPQSHAVSLRRPVCRQCCRRQGHMVRRTPEQFDNTLE